MKKFLCGVFAVCLFSTSTWAAVQTTAFDGTKLPKGVKFDGTFTSGLRWTDKNGDNYVIFSNVTKQTDDEVNSVYLYATHYVVNDGKAKNLRVMKDLSEKCDADNVTEFRPNSFSVTDLDNDDVGEVTFAYTVGCVSDVSPLTLKLLVLEGGEKYIIRGETLVELDGEKVGGKKEIDAAFKKAPKPFLDFAEKKCAAQVAGK